MRLWLMRHAELPNMAGVCYGASDLAADQAQTEAAAARLARVLPAGAVARCSPLRRCRALADHLQRLRSDLAIATEPRLSEMDFGEWEGQRWDSIGPSAMAAWTGDFADHRPGGGESVRHFMRRVGDALQAFSSLPYADGLWITHAGVIRAATLWAAGKQQVVRADQWPADGVAFGDWTVLEIQPAA